MSRPVVARSMLFMGSVFALSMLSCGREPTGPGGASEGMRYSHGIAFQTEFPSGYSAWWTAQKAMNQHLPLAYQVADPGAFSRVRIALQFPDSAVAKDTVIDFPDGVAQVAVPLTVLLPATAPTSGVTLRGGLQYQNAAGATIWEKTGLSVLVVPATPGATPPAPVMVVPTYAGPGASAVSVEISPRTRTVATGQALKFSAVARTAAGAVEGAAPIVFTSSQPTRATVNAATGDVTAGSARATVTIKAALLSGASDTAILTIQPPPSAIVAVSGGAQTATVNGPVTNPVIIQVNATDGLPVSGVTVTFAAQNGGTVGTATATTGTDGRAQTTWRLGSTAGAQTLTVTSSGLTGSPVTFTATATAGAATQIVADSGAGQSGTVGTALATKFVARVTDALGNAVAGASVTWAVASGGGSLSNTTATTDANGRVRATLTMGSVAGANTVTVTSSGLTGSPVSFTATGTAGAATQLAFTTSPTGTVNAGDTFLPAPVVTARDPYGNTATSFTGNVTLAIGTNGGTGSLYGTTTVAAVAGVATFSSYITINATGIGYTLTASSGTLTAATSPAFNLASNRPVRSTFAVSGSGQTSTVNTALASPFIVKVDDAGGYGVQGVVVTWAVASGGGSLGGTISTTDINGFAQTTLTTGSVAGANSVTATVSSGTGSPVTFTATGTARAAAIITADSGAGQSGTVGTALATKFVARVTDALGNAVAGTSVIWAVASGGGSLGNTTATTDATGRVRATLTLGAAPGVNTVTVTSSGLTGSPVSFTATGTVGAATSIVADSGAGQSGTVGTALASKLVAKVTDALGNAVAGTPVTWASSGGGSLSNTTATTDANGRVRATLTLGSVAGANSVTVTSSGLTGSPLTFTATGSAGAATQLAFTVTPTSATAGGPLPTAVVAAKDALNNVVPSFTGSVTLAITANPGGGTLAGTTTVTAVAGIATFPGLSINKAGTGYVLTVSSVGLTPASTTPLTIVANTATQIAADSGTGQTGTVGTALARPFVVKATDAFGNAVPGVAVSWAVTGGGGAIGTMSPTDANGRVRGTLVLGSAPGANTVTVTSGSLSGSPVTFTATGTAGAAATIMAESGTGQSGTVNTALGSAFVAKVTDSYGNAVVGASVTWAVTTGGTLSGTTSTTDANGRVRATLTLGSAAGVNVVTATSSGLAGSPVTFTATGTAGAAATIMAESGTGQSGTVGTPLSSAFVAKVTDSYDNAVAGASVTWAVSAGGGSLSDTTRTTDVNGRVRATLTLGSAPGANTVTATSGSLSGSPLTFTATAGAGLATQLTFTTSPSSSVAGAALASTPVVTARDLYGNTATSFTGSVTIAIGTNPGSGTLSGTTTVAAVAGVATFSGLSIEKSGVGYTLTAAASGGLSATSGAFAITNGVATTIAKDSGDFQVGTISTALPQQLVAKVTDAYGNPVAGVAVIWAVSAGGGSISSAAGTTDAAGRVRTTFTVDAVAQHLYYYENRVTATSGSLTGSPATFSAVAIAPPTLHFDQSPVTTAAGVPLNIVVALRTGIFRETVVTSFTGNVTVAIQYDAGFGNAPLVGTTTVAAVAGVATFTNVSITDASALGGFSNQYRLVATSAGIPPSGLSYPSFHITPAAAAAIAAVSGSGQTGTVNTALGQPFIAKVTDAFGNAVAGVPVTWAVASGGGSLSGTTDTTNSSGLVQTTLTTGSVAGANSVTVTRSGLTGSPLTFSATGTAGAATQLAFTNGPNGTVNAGNAFSPAPVVAARDANGNTNTSFTDSVTIAIGTNAGSGSLFGTATVAAVAGVATFSDITINDTGLGYTLTASSGALTTATSAAFNLTSNGPVHSTFAVSGSGQTGVVNTALASPFIVKVRDAGSYGVQGVTVTWAVSSGGGTLSVTTTTTDINGRAQTTLTTGIVAGANIVTATVGSGSGSPVTFTATGSAGAAATIAADSGTGQSGTLSAALSSAFVAKVIDAHSNPVAGATVTWAVTGGGGTLSSSTSTTDVNGRARTTLTLGSTAGTNTVTATSGALSGSPVTFTATANAGAATQLAFTASPAATAIGAPLSPTPVVTAQDASGNTATSFTGNVTIAVGTNPANGTLSGTTTVAAVAGVATFSGLSINAVGNGYTLSATSGALTAATSTAFNITSSVTAAATGDWSNSATWVGGVVPDSSLKAVIPTGITVTVDADVKISGLSIYGTGVLAQGARTVQVWGDIATDTTASITCTSGITEQITLSAANVKGRFCRYKKYGSGTVTANGRMIVDSVWHVLGDNFSLGGNRLNTKVAWIGSGGSQMGTGYLSMSSSLDSLIVSDSLLVGDVNDGSFNRTTPSAGAIKVSGNFRQVGIPGKDYFHPTGTNRVFLFGNKQVVFEDTTTSTFKHLEIWDTRTFASVVRVEGNMRVIGVVAGSSGRVKMVSGGTLTGVPVSQVTIKAFELSGVFADSGTFAPDTAVFTGGTSSAEQIIPDAIGSSSAITYKTLRTTGYANLRPNTTNTNWVITKIRISSGELRVGNGTTTFLRISDSLVVNGTGVFRMVNAQTDVWANGHAYFGGGSTVGHLTAGTLFVAKNFTQANNPMAFAPSGTHGTNFHGASDTVTFAHPDSSAFAGLNFSDGAGVHLNSDVTVKASLSRPGSSGAATIASVGGTTRRITAAGAYVNRESANSTVFSNVKVRFVDGANVFYFDRVKFSGFTSAGGGALLELVRSSGSYTFDSLNLADAGFAASNSEHYVSLNGGSGVSLTLTGVTPTSGVSGTHYITPGGGTVTWP